MATEVLRPHDVLSRPHHSFRSHRKPNPNLKAPPPAPTAKRGREGSAPKNSRGKAGFSKRGGAKWEGVYAGSGFSISPEPSSLPLPSFQVRMAKISAGAATAVVDEVATIDLRRMLRLG